MDPIMKLLEEDEDESMHSGADVDAFTAELNRDMKGDTSTSLQPSDSDNGMNASQTYSQWQTSNQEENTNQQNSLQPHVQYSSMDFSQHGSGAENKLLQTDVSNSQEQDPLPSAPSSIQGDLKHQPAEPNPHFSQPTGLRIAEKCPTINQDPNRMVNMQSESQYSKLQSLTNEKVTTTEQARAAPNKNNKQVPFAMLLPRIVPQLDKEKAARLQMIYARLKKNEIPKEEFVRQMKDIVGDQMLKSVVQSLNAILNSAQSSQDGPQQLQLQGSVPQHNLKMPPTGATVAGLHSFAQIRPQGPNSTSVPSHAASSTSYPSVNTTSEQGLNKQPKHMHYPPTNFPGYDSTGVGNFPQYAGAVSSSAPSVRSQSHDSQIRQVAPHPSFASPQLSGSTQPVIVPKFERPTSVTDSQRMHGGPFPHPTSNPPLRQTSTPRQSVTSKEQNTGAFSAVSNVKHEPADQDNDQQKSQYSTPAANSAAPTEQIGSRNSGATAPASVNARTPPKKPTIGQKKPLETLSSSPPMPAKKQKVTGAFLDQSIEQLNDVTAISGVNLREEEEQLFSGTKEDSRVSEASRRVVQEEEERLILQRAPLQKKLENIMAKCGLKGISNDVERCLSLCLEERMRGLISNLIRLSKQRMATEKSRYRTVVTSDVRQQISLVNKAAKEEWEKKQAEAEKLRKLNEPEGSTGTDAEKEKDEGRGKAAPKVNKEEDDKMRASAANVAARAAVGGSDMLSRWQLLAEQNRQKRGGDLPSGSQSTEDVNVTQKPSSSGTSAKDNQDVDRKGQSGFGHASGNAAGRRGKVQAATPQAKEACSISVKDVIAVLEREPQMSKSPLIYRLYEKVRTDATTES